MKKIISAIVAGIVILVVLLNMPSNIIDEVKMMNNKSQYAAIPPVAPPTNPPKK